MPGPECVRPDVRVRRAGHPDRPVRGAVQDRDDDLGAPRVEGADHADDGLVVRVGVAVRRALARVPLAGLGGRVVAGLVADRLVAGLEVVLLQLELDRLDHLLGLRPAGALERQVRRDDQSRLAGCPRSRSRSTRRSAARSRSRPRLRRPRLAGARGTHCCRRRRRSRPRRAPACRSGQRALRERSYSMSCTSVARSLSRHASARRRRLLRGRGSIGLTIGVCKPDPLRPLDDRRSAAAARTIRGGRSGGTGRRAGLKIRFPPGSVGSIPTFGISTGTSLVTVSRVRADRDPHRRGRLPRAERGHPRGRRGARSTAAGGARRARGLARARRRAGRAARAARDLRDPAARRDDHRHVADEPVQARRRRRAVLETLRAARARRARRDRRRGHARRRGAAARGARVPGRRRAEDDRQRPLGTDYTFGFDTAVSIAPRRSTGCTRPRSRTTA